MSDFKIEVDLSLVDDTFRRLLQRVSDLRPVLLSIGEELTESTKQRFRTQQEPDGTPWKPNSWRTVVWKGHSIQLTGKTHQLQGTINYQLIGTSVEIGSPMKYAKTQQFGEKEHHWHELMVKIDIPARPFLGLSHDDETRVLEDIRTYLGMQS